MWKSSVLLIHKLHGDNQKHSVEAKWSYLLTNRMETTQKHSVEASCLTSSQRGRRQPRSTVWKPSVLLPHKLDRDNPETQCGSQVSYFLTNWIEATQKHSVEPSVLLPHKLDGDNPETQCGSQLSYFLTNRMETIQKHSMEAQCITSSQTGWRQHRSTVWKPIVLLPSKLDRDNPEPLCGSPVSYYLTNWMETTQKHSVDAQCLTFSQTGWRQSISTVWKSSIFQPHKLERDNPEAQCRSQVSYCLTNRMETIQKHSVEAKCLIS